MSKRLPKNFWYTLLGAHLAVLLWVWWQGSGSLLNQGWPSVFLALGRLAGLLAASNVLLQFAFMGRTPYLERSFGLDKLSRIHRASGKFALFFILLHPVLLIISYSQLAGISLLAQFKSFFFDYQHVQWAVLGLVLFVVVVGTSLMIVRSKVRYESWYFVHLLVYLAVFASFWHQIAVGSDLISNRLFYAYWLALYALVLGAHVVFRFGRPLYLMQRHRFYVTRVVRESHNAVSLYIRGQHLSKFPIHGGQFMIVRFFTKGLWWQAHPFSLSMLPNGQELRITVKELGDFTRQVGTIAPGTKMLVDGPYGVFTSWMGVAPKKLFIAGGIGITPIRSLMEEVVTNTHESVLLYANRTEQDIVFKDELEKVVAGKPARVVHVLSDQPNYTGETGHLDAEKIKRLVPDVADRDVYLCGPVPMMDALKKVLQQLGVTQARLHYERFAL